MKTLSTLHLVQFSFWELQSFNLRQGGTAILGPNGAGKTSVADAIQIAMLGAHGGFMNFNTQSVYKDKRSVRDYALGTMRSGDSDDGVITRKRDEALSYITLVFEGDKPGDCLSAGVCIHALANESTHRTLGLYVLPGVRLKLDDHLGAVGNGEVAPLEWNAFEALARQLAKQAGRTPSFSAAPEMYLSELLHGLQTPGRSIDKAKFLRAFSQSLKLKDVKSVNDYLRGYLVDAKPIDKQGTLQHIKTVRALAKQIEEVKEQIVRLNDIDKKFNTVSELYRTRAVANAVKLQLQLESADDRVSTLEDNLADLGDKIEALNKSLPTMESECRVLEETHNNLLSRYSSDPNTQAPEANRQLREAHQSRIEEFCNTINSISLQIRQTLETVSRVFEAEDSSRYGSIETILSTLDGLAQSENPIPVANIEHGLQALSAAAASVETLLKKHDEAHQLARDNLQAANGKASAAKQGIRVPENDVAKAMSLFQESGIGCRTVASLVQVTDVRWQPAIESALGRNRFALVVDAGREDDAVRMLRNLVQPLYNVTVVQPSHLKNDIGREPEPQLVSALLSGENKVALTFLRRILGPTRQVDTEDELRIYERALTKDGMQSGNGGTRRIRLVSASDFALGVKVSAADLGLLQKEAVAATEQENLASKRAGKTKAASEKLRHTLEAISIDKYRLALSKLQSAQDDLRSVGEITPESLPQYLQDLKRDLDNAKKAAVEARSRHTKASSDLATLSTQQTNKRDDLASAQAVLTSIETKHSEALADPDYDTERSAAMYDKAFDLMASSGPEDALKYLDQEAKRANDRLAGAESTARSDFAGFINDMSFNLVEERSDWRKASAWVKGHVRKLTDSTLAEYEQSAEEARIAANQSFRADVAFRMREAINRVHADIHDLNKVLSACPEFTGGEKYRFVAHPAIAHQKLYDLIVSSALTETGTASLLETDDDVQRTLVNFLEACETGEGRANNPLEDYRLLFNFDLEIRVGDKKVDSLSKRLGVGSGGEHLVPFYVIAGASLANAYRLKAGEPHEGLALMLIDEAFRGFDAQNTYVTAQFLRTLGLQIILAGPDADASKLVPVLDSYYDIERFGTDSYADEIVIKPAAKELLESDMPVCHPELVERMVEQLSLA